MRPLTESDLARRQPLWHPTLPFVVFWSHKAACTAIAHWFFAVLGSPQRAGPEPRHGYQGIRIHDYEGVFKARPDYLAGCVEALAAGRPALKFVRDPAARAYSAYVATCREAAVRKASFWGAKVRAQVVANRFGAGVERTRAYSFPDFVEWLAAADPESVNVHVRPQYQAWEALHPRELQPIETLSQRLSEIEQRFGLPAIAADATLLRSKHHRAKSLDLSGAELERHLRVPLPVQAGEPADLPTVDSQRLADTAIGARLRQVLAADYAAYPIY